jgi:hypothetical protein
MPFPFDKDDTGPDANDAALLRSVSLSANERGKMLPSPDDDPAVSQNIEKYWADRKRGKAKPRGVP